MIFVGVMSVGIVDLLNVYFLGLCLMIFCEGDYLVLIYFWLWWEDCKDFFMIDVVYVEGEYGKFFFNLIVYVDLIW